MGCRSSYSLCGRVVVWLRQGGGEASLSPRVTVMHQEGACGWQMKWDHWKVRFEVECGSSSNAVLPSHLSVSKPGLMTAIVIKGSSSSGGTFTHIETSLLK